MIKIETLYVDLDGVLVNFELGIHDVIQEYVGPKRDTISNTDAVLLDEMFTKLEDIGYERAGELLAHKPYKAVIRTIIGMEPEWWTHLEWMPDGKELWDAIKGYNPTVLSSPLNKTNWEEKNTWVARELGKDITVLIEDDKEIHADPTSLLIDDRPGHSKFEEFGGHIIHHKNSKDSIKQLVNYDLSALEPVTQTYERRIHNFDSFVNESYNVSEAAKTKQDLQDELDRWEGFLFDMGSNKLSNPSDPAKHKAKKEKIEKKIAQLKGKLGKVNESYVQKSTTIKWKPSKNDAVEGFLNKSFAHPKGDGDMIANQDKVKEKWSKRLASLLGAEIDLSKTDMFPKEKGKSYRGSMDFRFEDADGEKYRIYQDGEGPKSASYTIQKYKK